MENLYLLPLYLKLFKLQLEWNQCWRTAIALFQISTSTELNVLYKYPGAYSRRYGINISVTWWMCHRWQANWHNQRLFSQLTSLINSFPTEHAIFFSQCCRCYELFTVNYLIFHPLTCLSVSLTLQTWSSKLFLCANVQLL